MERNQLWLKMWLVCRRSLPKPIETKWRRSNPVEVEHRKHMELEVKGNKEVPVHVSERHKWIRLSPLVPMSRTSNTKREIPHTLSLHLQKQNNMLQS